MLYELQNIIQNTDDLLFVEVSAPKNVYKDFESIVIFTDAETRMSRLLERGMDREDIVSRMASQKSDDWWKSLGIVVQNNNLSELKIELDKLFKNTS